MYSVENETHPDFFLSMFAKNSQFHSYPTRDCNNFRPEFFRTNTKQFTVASQGPRLWNYLPLEVKVTPSFASFKIRLKNI